jgi:hypothetical protein
MYYFMLNVYNSITCDTIFLFINYCAGVFHLGDS